jgi:hypothetical protein
MPRLPRLGVTVALGVGMIVVGAMSSARAQMTATGIPMFPGNPTKQEDRCRFGHWPGAPAPVASPAATGEIANATVGPTGASANPGESEVSEGTGRSSRGSVFLSTSNPSNVGVQC